MDEETLRPGPNDIGKRIDRILRVLYPEEGLSFLYGALRKGDIRVNGKRVRQDYKLREGDELTVKKRFPKGKPSPAGASRRRGAAGSETLFPIESLILHEDGDFLVLNKPRGALVHGGGGNEAGSLDDAVKAYLAPKIPPSLAFSPGPLHRLDRNTTGVLFFSKSLAGARRFSEALAAGKTRKNYLALLEGELPEPQVWQDFLSRVEESRRTRLSGMEEKGKAAFTEVYPLIRAGGYTLASFFIGTGRTHQIRAQAAARGYPLAGDRKYGAAPFEGGYILHAREFALLEGERPPFKTVLTVTAPPSPGIVERIERIFGKKGRTVLRRNRQVP